MAVQGKYDIAYQFGRLGVRLDLVTDNRAIDAATHMVFAAFVAFWRKPIAESVDHAARSQDEPRDRQQYLRRLFEHLPPRVSLSQGRRPRRDPRGGPAVQRDVDADGRRREPLHDRHRRARDRQPERRDRDANHPGRRWLRLGRLGGRGRCKRQPSHDLDDLPGPRGRASPRGGCPGGVAAPGQRARRRATSSGRRSRSTRRSRWRRGSPRANPPIPLRWSASCASSPTSCAATPSHRPAPSATSTSSSRPSSRRSRTTRAR